MILNPGWNPEQSAVLCVLNDYVWHRFGYTSPRIKAIDCAFCLAFKPFFCEPMYSFLLWTFSICNYVIWRSFRNHSFQSWSLTVAWNILHGTAHEAGKYGIHGAVTDKEIWSQIIPLCLLQPNWEKTLINHTVLSWLSQIMLLLISGPTADVVPNHDIIPPPSLRALIGLLLMCMLSRIWEPVCDRFSTCHHVACRVTWFCGFKSNLHL